MGSNPIPMEIDTTSMEQSNRMEFGMRMAGHLILKEIKNGCKSNLVLSPLSLHAMLNLVASGSIGRTLQQLLSFLESESIGNLNSQSSQMMALATTGQAFLESENASDLNSQSSQPTREEVSSRSSNQLRHDPSVFWFPFHHSPTLSSVKFDNPIKGKSSLFSSTHESTSFPFSSANRNAGSFTGSNQEPIISFVNGIWVDHRYPLKHSFKQVAEDIYKAKAENVDFLTQAEEVRKEVNLWVKKASKGLINDLLPAGFIDTTTILVLANALYFEGKWLHPFDSSNTKIEDFHLLDGRTVNVLFMISYTSKPQFYGSFEGFKLLKLPYNSGQDSKQFSMYIFLPDKKDGLQELIQHFTSDSKLLHQNWELQQVELSKIYIPKFKFSYEIDAKKIMRELGLTMIFEKNRELTEIVDGSDICVTDAIHKSFIEVNEEGTVATAMTVFACAECCFLAPEFPPPSFVADYPFMFMIKEEVSQIVLFTGAVLNPL